MTPQSFRFPLRKMRLLPNDKYFCRFCPNIKSRFCEDVENTTVLSYNINKMG